jgi:hypothetical protein
LTLVFNLSLLVKFVLECFYNVFLISNILVIVIDEFVLVVNLVFQFLLPDVFSMNVVFCIFDVLLQMADLMSISLLFLVKFFELLLLSLQMLINDGLGDGFNRLLHFLLHEHWLLNEVLLFLKLGYLLDCLYWFYHLLNCLNLIISYSNIHRL